MAAIPPPGGPNFFDHQISQIEEEQRKVVKQQLEDRRYRTAECLMERHITREQLLTRLNRMLDDIQVRVAKGEDLSLAFEGLRALQDRDQGA